MKVASFSPMPPERSGIADYTALLLPALRERLEIEVVKRGRGDRLKADPQIFSGLIWTGERSIELGLADGLGSVEYVAREVIKAETIVDYTPRENIAERVVRRFGAASAEALWGAATAPRASPVR